MCGREEEKYVTPGYFGEVDTKPPDGWVIVMGKTDHRVLCPPCIKIWETKRK
jgi:hypothetical protein